jgi:hypothetical protein
MDVQPPDRSEPADRSSPEEHAATVEELVAEAKFHEEFEESRLNTNNQRAGWLLALNGVLLGLVANQAREMLTQSRLLGEVGRWFAGISLGLAALFILLSAGCALMVIFRIYSWGWDDEEIENIAEEKSISRTKVAAQGTFLLGLRNRILRERRAYGKRKKWLTAAFACLGVALVAVTIHVGVYSVRTIQNPCPVTGQVQRSSPKQEQGRGQKRSRAIRAAFLTTPAKSPFDPPKGGSCPR